MNKELEEIIVKSFFNKRIQKRVLFELFSSKKRYNALGRMDYSDTLRKEFMFEIPKPNSDPKEIENLLRKYGAGNDCYVMSFNKEIDGKEMTLTKALEEVIWYGLPSLISCIHGKLAYFQEEQESGSPERFLLKKN